MKSGTPTKYPGVFKLGHRKYLIRGKAKNPRTGRREEVRKVLDNVTAHEAVRRRVEILDEIRSGTVAARKRARVGEYARSWMRSKALKIDAETASKYAYALDLHILPTLGDFYYDALTKQDVQAWVDESLMKVRILRNGTRRPYSRDSVHSWYRILRTMTRDAMDDLGLDRDPTMRISFPDPIGRDGGNSLSPEELERFLRAMRDHFPHHFALTAVLAFTGMRFCHASALQWDDWDEVACVIRVRRKQVRGRVGRVSRKKRAPSEVPVEPALAAILRAHRRRLLAEQAPGLAAGWMFPSRTGGLRTPSSFAKAWGPCLKAAGVDRRFTPHGLRYTFTDLVRLAKVDAVVRRALTGHVTESMQDHYSDVALDEKRSAVAGVHQLVSIDDPNDPAETPEEHPETHPDDTPPTSPPKGGTFGGTSGRND